MGVIDNGPGANNYWGDALNAYDGDILIKVRGQTSRYLGLTRGRGARIALLWWLRCLNHFERGMKRGGGLGGGACLFFCCLLATIWSPWPLNPLHPRGTG